MDDRIGRLAAIGVNRAATAQAVRIVEHWSFDARPVQCTRQFWSHSTDPIRTTRGTATPFEFGSTCVSFNKVMTAGSRQLTATARRLCAAGASTGAADGPTRERMRESAVGRTAGAILGRSHQI